MNQEKLSQSIQALLKELEPHSFDREGLTETPRRVAKAYATLFSGYNQKLEDIVTLFDQEAYDEMVLVKDIEFYSTCEHHMLPFFGKAHIAYIPHQKIIGLSKVPRVLEMFARRLQNQERITTQVADALQKILDAKGVAVVLEAQHFCMQARGIQKQSSHVSTSALRGLFKKDSRTREEFFNLIKK